MNIMERYISAYVFHCLFPQATASSVHIEYVYEVLRETKASPKNELLRHVLDFIRQSDPASEEAQKSVRNYILSMLFSQQEPGFIGHRHKGSVATVFTISEGGKPIAFAGCLNEAEESCLQELRKQFPGITFQED